VRSRLIPLLGTKSSLRAFLIRLACISRSLSMRRLFHLFSLLALVVASAVQGMSMPVMLEASGCVNTCRMSEAASDPCTQNSTATLSGSRTPSCPASTRSCSSQGSVVVFTQEVQKQKRGQLDQLIEPSPWPNVVSTTIVGSGPLYASLEYFQPVPRSSGRTLERLAKLSIFRI
jgi:hypothetical protein